MRRVRPRCLHYPRVSSRSINVTGHQKALIEIQEGTFYRHHPSRSSEEPPIFHNLTFSLPSYVRRKNTTQPVGCWAVIGPSSSSRTAFLELLRGQHICLPPYARTYPYLQLPHVVAKNPKFTNPAHAVHYVGFDAERDGSAKSRILGAYLSARYESRREDTDFSVLDYLRGQRAGWRMWTWGFWSRCSSNYDSYRWWRCLWVI